MHEDTIDVRETTRDTGGSPSMPPSDPVSSAVMVNNSAPIGVDAPLSDRGTAIQHALLSAFIPGAAQLVQGRWIAALTQFGVVVAYLAGIFAAGPKHAVVLAIFWNAYSALEAYWHERD